MKIIKSFALGLAIMAVASCAQPQQNENESGENQVIENIMARRSIRKYKSEPVNQETLAKIMECGINAPSGMNKQSWEVRVVSSPAVMDRIIAAMAEANPDISPDAIRGCFRGAPTMVFIANDPSYDFSVIDCGLLSENIMLSAWSLGVGSVCLGSPIRFLNNAPEAQAILEFSDGYTPVICIGLGYADESPDAKPRDPSKVKYIE